MEPRDYAASLARNTSLTTLILKNIAFVMRIHSIAEALRCNKTLRRVEIIDRAMTSQDLRILHNGLSSNSSLVELSLSEHCSECFDYHRLQGKIADNKANYEKSNQTNQSPDLSLVDQENEEQKRHLDTDAVKDSTSPEISTSARNSAIPTLHTSACNIPPTISALPSPRSSLMDLLGASIGSVKEEYEKKLQKMERELAWLTTEKERADRYKERCNDEVEQLKEQIRSLLVEIETLKRDKELNEQNSLLTKQLQREIKLIKEENAKLKKMIDAGKKSEHSSDNNELNIDIPYEELTIGESIGAGGYGEVFRAQWHGQNVAVKGIKVTDIETGKIDSLIHEARTVMRLHHKHVVLSMGTTMKPDTSKIMLVMEYMKHGSLEDLLFKHNVKLERHQVTVIALDIAKGLNYLHCLTPKIIHRDLKCANILLYHNRSRAKISDLGTARFLNKNSLAKTCQGGTIGYFAPEILEEEEYDEKADVYSFGVVLLVLATSSNNLPTTRTPVKLRSRINELLDSSATMADEEQFRELVHDCCQVYPNERPSMKQCIDVLKSLRKKQANSH